MPRLSFYLPFVAAMAIVVVASNVLVQFPVDGQVGSLMLADVLTWGAFTYPVAFLVTDLTNRQFGPSVARRVVLAGFIVGVTLSFWTSIPRIAVASGTAYLIGQLLDISVFNRLRRQRWWHAPLAGSMLGSVLDTALFFSIAFAASFSFVGPNDAFAIENAPVLGIFALEAPRWISWAIGDFWVKLLVCLVMLLPYAALLNTLKTMREVAKPV